MQNARGLCREKLSVAFESNLPVEYPHAAARGGIAAIADVARANISRLMSCNALPFVGIQFLNRFCPIVYRNENEPTTCFSIPREHFDRHAAKRTNERTDRQPTSQPGCRFVHLCVGPSARHSVSQSVSRTISDRVRQSVLDQKAALIKV